MKHHSLYLLLLLAANAFAQTANHHATVYFDFDRYNLKKEACTTLDSVAALANTDENVYIYGFTDDHGSRTYNDTLALHRAHVVNSYLKGFNKKACFIARGDTDPAWATFTDGQKRRVTVSFGRALAFGKPKELLRNEDGISVSGYTGLGCGLPDEVLDKDDFGLKGYLSASQMIAGDMYAVATDGEVIETGGMVSMDLSEEALKALAGRPLTVKLPVKGKALPGMTVWIGVEENGIIRWKNTEVKVSTDGKNYSMEVPPQRGRVYFNCDRRVCGNDGREIVGNTGRDSIARQAPKGPWQNKVIYIATHKKHKFRDLSLRGGGYSMQFAAKVNDTLWAFTAPINFNTKGLIFQGYTQEDRALKRPTVRINLKRCVYTAQTDGNDLYYICPECINKPVTVREKGFWAWIKRTLGVG